MASSSGWAGRFRGKPHRRLAGCVRAREYLLLPVSLRFGPVNENLRSLCADPTGATTGAERGGGANPNPPESYRFTDDHNDFQPLPIEDGPAPAGGPALTIVDGPGVVDGPDLAGDPESAGAPARGPYNLDTYVGDLVYAICTAMHDPGRGLYPKYLGKTTVPVQGFSDDRVKLGYAPAFKSVTLHSGAAPHPLARAPGARHAAERAYAESEFPRSIHGERLAVLQSQAGKWIMIRLRRDEIGFRYCGVSWIDQGAEYDFHIQYPGKRYVVMVTAAIRRFLAAAKMAKVADRSMTAFPEQLAQLALALAKLGPSYEIPGSIRAAIERDPVGYSLEPYQRITGFPIPFNPDTTISYPHHLFVRAGNSFGLVRDSWTAKASIIPPILNDADILAQVRGLVAEVFRWSKNRAAWAAAVNLGIRHRISLAQRRAAAPPAAQPAAQPAAKRRRP